MADRIIETIDDCVVEAQLFRGCSIQVKGELTGQAGRSMGELRNSDTCGASRGGPASRDRRLVRPP